MARDGGAQEQGLMLPRELCEHRSVEVCQKRGLVLVAFDEHDLQRRCRRQRELVHVWHEDEVEQRVRLFRSHLFREARECGASGGFVTLGDGPAGNDREHRLSSSCPSGYSVSLLPALKSNACPVPSLSASIRRASPSRPGRPAPATAAGARSACNPRPGAHPPPPPRRRPSGLRRRRETPGSRLERGTNANLAGGPRATSHSCRIPSRWWHRRSAVPKAVAASSR